MDITDREFQLLKELLFNLSGIEIPEEKRYLFTTRLMDLLAHEKCSSFSDFYRKLTLPKSEQSCRLFVESMTTHESGFFRDGHPFRVFCENILPSVAKLRAQQARFLPPRLRILSAGASFGQEAYSIAICIHRWLSGQSVFLPENVSILGIDISSKAIERAKNGHYSDLEIGKNLSAYDRQQFFSKQGERWALSDEIKKMASFQQMSLDRSFSDLGKFDIIFCRNVIIYFPIDVRKRVVNQLHSALVPEGVLFLGSAESLFNISDLFTSVTVGETVYYKSLQTSDTKA
jgi:chemotaxis protein methyltransferase CheR